MLGGGSDVSCGLSGDWFSGLGVLEGVAMLLDVLTAFVTGISGVGCGISDEEGTSADDDVGGGGTGVDSISVSASGSALGDGLEDFLVLLVPAGLPLRFGALG